jgi:hypothetical protein
MFFRFSRVHLAQVFPIRAPTSFRIILVAKYFQETYRAIPTVRTHDKFDISLAAPCKVALGRPAFFPGSVCVLDH